MNNTKLDEITKEIISNSKLELQNPEFNRIVLNIILLENQRQKTIYKVVLYAIIFLCFDVLMFLLVNLSNFIAGPLTSESGSLSNGLTLNMIVLKNLVLENNIIQYSIIVIPILIVIQKLVSFKAGKFAR
ncbi:MAG: hypothetical protein HN936_02795 [Bacteroidetes bacterium]|jgi:hypothetical protein|nr:hypothetical protein [Bacteroidota bacterium]MBT4400410.1 hypothetical protein [Bacteroidota bacterium]MBT4412135.1 hypothetical protein [Bacteroidota bacterium]MBT7092145.1 hypothetical protein [Bacteroidota bacterium]MBT7464176.1 hypothetical protein [Bacteroidota bacterium]